MSKYRNIETRKKRKKNERKKITKILMNVKLKHTALEAREEESESESEAELLK